MKAIIQSKYGSFEVLEYGEAEKPSPGGNEVLVKVHAAAINYGNMVLVIGRPFLTRLESGLLRPKYLNSGSDVGGMVADNNDHSSAGSFNPSCRSTAGTSKILQ